MSEELKLCPFCGGECMIDKIISERDKDSDKYLIICTSCMNQTNLYLYENDAIKAWNKRYLDHSGLAIAIYGKVYALKEIGHE